MNFIDLTCSELNVENIVNKVKAPGCGAVSVFVGTVRDNCDGRRVKNLYYECYREMTIRAIENICKRLRNKWESVAHIAVFHRLGQMSVTENCVVIAVSSPHRAESLAAVNYAIDELKATVPIWKKESYYIEPAKWKENSECTWKS